MNTYMITVGDWSCDGHNQSDNFHFTTNKNKKEILIAFRKACRKANVDLEEHGKNSLFKDYEDSTIPPDKLKRLKDIGVNFDSFDNMEDEEDEGLPCTPEDVFKLVMELAKTELPDLQYKIIEPECILNNIGYGVYYG
jgi:hypothetical protein